MVLFADQIDDLAARDGDGLCALRRCVLAQWGFGEQRALHGRAGGAKPWAFKFEVLETAPPRMKSVSRASGSCTFPLFALHMRQQCRERAGSYALRCREAWPEASPAAPGAELLAHLVGEAADSGA